MRRLTIVLCLIALVTLAARVATAQPAGEGSQRVAICDVLVLVEEMLEQPVYDDARQAIEDNYSQQLALLESELQDLLTRRNAAVPNSIEFNEINQQGGAVQQRYQAMRDQGSGEMERLGTQQAREVYSKITEAARAVADEQGFGFVFATRDPTRTQDATSVASLAQQLLARPVIVHPEGAEITAAVRTKLGLPEPAASTPATPDSNPTTND